MEKVFADEEPRCVRQDRGEAFSGEKHNVQLAYSWSGSPSWAQVGIEADPALRVSLRTVELEPAQYIGTFGEKEGFLRTKPGLYPDILKTCKGEIRLIPDQWHALWISMEARDGAEPGEYPVTVSLKLDEGEEQRLTYMFQLLPGKLPEQRLIFTQWFHGDCIAQQYHCEVFSEKWWELTEKYVRFAAEHGMNMILTPVFTPALDTAPGAERLTVQLTEVWREKAPEREACPPGQSGDAMNCPGNAQSGDAMGRSVNMQPGDESGHSGSVQSKEGFGWHFGFDRLARWIRMCRRCGIQYFEISHLFTQWGAEHAPKVVAWDDAAGGSLKRIFGWETDAEGREYRQFLEAFLPALTAFLDREGLRGKAWFHISDEPGGDSLERYGRLSGFVHGLLDGYPVMDALSDYSFYEKGYVDTPVCATVHIRPYLQHGVNPLWAYYCGCHVQGVSNRLLAMPGARVRCIGAQLYDSGVQGFLHWGYNFWMTCLSKEAIDPYRVSDAGGGFAAGDSFSVYPGEDGPLAAVSLELFQEALQDLRALEYAEETAGKEAVEKLLEEIPWKEYDRCCFSSEELLEFRRKVNRLIMK